MNSDYPRFAILCFCFVFIISCNKEKTKPVDLIGKEKMVEILADVHLGETSITTFGLNERDSIAKMYYEHIYRIHGIEEEAFYSSMEYYNSIPEEWAEIYKGVLKLLENRKDNSKTKSKESKPKG